MPTPLRKTRYLLEYAGLRAGLFLVDRLPLTAAESIGAFCAGAFYRTHGARRRIAGENVRRSGIATDARDVRRIVRASFRHFALVAIESLRFGEFFNQENWRARTVLDIHPDAEALIARPGQGLILVSAHLGNWEVAGKLFSFMRPVTAIARKMNNPYSNRIMERRSEGTRVTLIPKRDTDARRLIRTLREGRTLGIILDQHAGDQGIMVDFFGVPASTFPTPALLHQRLGTPVCFGYCLRTGPMQYRLTIDPPVQVPASGDRHADTRALVRQLNRALEQAIRATPEQYLWAHRRWRNTRS